MGQLQACRPEAVKIINAHIRDPGIAQSTKHKRGPGACCCCTPPWPPWESAVHALILDISRIPQLGPQCHQDLAGIYSKQNPGLCALGQRLLK